MRILIVDDSRVMRAIVARSLRQAGYGAHAVVEAGNGVEALDAVRANPLDLVLCDWNMSEMTGIELLRTLRRQGVDVPFGFVTSEGAPQMREHARAAGATFLIAKPFTVESLQGALEPVLGR